MNAMQQGELLMRDAIWKFKTKRFEVILDCSPEEEPDYSWDDSGVTQQMCESGLWACVCFRARVLLDGKEISAEYLGNSIYENVSDFRKEHIGGSGGSYFKDMVRDAIEAARTHVKRQQDLCIRDA